MIGEISVKDRKWVLVNSENVVPYVCGPEYSSRMLIGDEMAGRPVLNVNEGTLAPHTRTGGDSHEETEIYYVAKCKPNACYVGLDDEKLLVKGIKFNLEQEGYQVVTAFDGEEAIRLAHDESIDLILLDLMLPKTDGFTVCRTIRGFSNVPIIMLTAKGEDIDKILGLEYGADDYITKPFNIREVTARIKAIVRRINPSPKGDSGKVMVSGDITLDYNFRRAVVNDRLVELTSKEFDLLELFLKNPDRVYTRENLLDILWGIGYPSEERTIDVHMRRLREKLEDNPAEPKYLRTKWGVGYYYKED